MHWLIFGLLPWHFFKPTELFMVDVVALVMDCKSPKGLKVEVVLLHCTLVGVRLSGCELEGLKRRRPKIVV